MEDSFLASLGVVVKQAISRTEQLALFISSLETTRQFCSFLCCRFKEGFLGNLVSYYFAHYIGLIRAEVVSVKCKCSSSGMRCLSPT